MSEVSGCQREDERPALAQLHARPVAQIQWDLPRTIRTGAPFLVPSAGSGVHVPQAREQGVSWSQGRIEWCAEPIFRSMLQNSC